MFGPDPLILVSKVDGVFSNRAFFNFWKTTKDNGKTLYCFGNLSCQQLK